MPSVTGEISEARRNRGATAALAKINWSREKWAALAMFIFSLAYLSVFRHHCSFEPDEGIVLQGAERILSGQVPYRDFFSFYTPGSFYLVAFIFRVFGDSFVIARTSLAVAGAVCSVITFLLARRVCSLSVALFAAVLTTVAGSAYRFLVLHNWYSTLLCCLCLYAAVRLFENRSASWAFATGLFASLALLIEQSKGAGVVLGLALASVILRFAQPGISLTKKQSAGFFAGLALPLLLTFVYFGAKRGLAAMLQSWLWPLQHYGKANHVPYGWQNWSPDAVTEIFRNGPLWLRVLKILAVSPGLVVPALPLVAAGSLVYWALRMRSGIRQAQAAYYVIISSIGTGLWLSVAATRADIIHFMYLTPLWYIVLAWTLAGSSSSRRWNVLRPYLAIYVVAAFGLLALALLLNATGARVGIETRRGLLTSSKDDAALRYLQSHTMPGQQVLVYPYLPLYNYLTATVSPAHYDYFQSGMNTPDQAHEIIASLQSNPDAGVLFEPWFPEKIANSWPETPISAIANDPISDHLAKNYRVCRMLTSSDNAAFEYMVRKDRVCP